MSEVFGIIAPHPPIMVEAVGRRDSAVTHASIDALGRARAALERWSPDAVVVISPHAPALRDAFVVDASARLEGSFGQFGAPDARYRYRGAPELGDAIVSELAQRGLPATERGRDVRLSPGVLDHGVLVPLSFLDPDGRVPLVTVAYSGFDLEAYVGLGNAIRAAADGLGMRVALVSSGDLSHRLKPEAPAGYSPHAVELDAAIVDNVRTGAFGALPDIPAALVEAGGECGLRSFTAMGGFAGADPVPTEVLAYEGPWGVGYLTALVGDAALRADAAAATPDSGSKGGMPGHDDSPIVLLARQAVEAYVMRHAVLEPPPFGDPDLPERAGAFVSLHRHGELRGCIGTILPTRDSLAEEVVHNAIQAATKDPRFGPMQPGELSDLDISVDVLREPESCTLEDLDPESYGVIVSSGWRRGLLLPDLEGVDDVKTQVDIAMRKAGILPHEPCRFERFRVDRYT